MNASTDPAQARRQARRSRRRAGFATLVALGAVAGLILLLTRPAPPAPAAAARPTATNPVTATGGAGGAAGYASPVRWVSLPAATSASPNQMPTGFPHTLAGAAAFAAAVAEFGYTASFSQAEQDAALYAAPSANGAPQAAQTLAEALRAWAGLPLTGALPVGDGADGRPLAVRAAATPSGATVDVLVQVTGYLSSQTTTTTTATRIDAVWDGAVSDWRYTQADLASPLPADPIGTTGFNDAGWSAIQGSS